jgi:hypothetical protein
MLETRATKRRREIDMGEAAKMRRVAHSAFTAFILASAVAGGASAQTSAPPAVSAEEATADNAVLLTIFLRHDQ